MAKEPTPKAAEPQETVTALTPIQHDGVDYPIGAAITMKPEQAAALYALQAAEPAAAPAAA